MIIHRISTYICKIYIFMYICIHVCVCMYICVCVMFRVGSNIGYGNLGEERGNLLIIEYV